MKNIDKEKNIDIDKFHEKIKHNDVNAMCDLAEYYRDKHDYTNMKKYYLMAIKHNNTMAMRELASHYGYVENNFDELQKYYELAIKHNDVEAMYEFAEYCCENINDEEENALSEKYYLMAIEHNHVEAMYKLAECYRNREQHEKSIKYYLLAIEHKYVEAMFELGYFYECIQPNYEQAKKYYKLGTEHNNVNSMFCLGRIYQKEKNYDMMKKYYEMTIDKHYNSDICDHCDWEAQIELAKYYETIEYDYKKALKYYYDAYFNGNFGIFDGHHGVKHKIDALEEEITLLKKADKKINIKKSTNIII
jgi:TPR repeat protein